MTNGSHTEDVRRSRAPRRDRRAFTLTELVIVIGLIGLMASLLLPVVGRMRTASNATRCAANLRQMGTAWSVVVLENDGRFIDFAWNTPPGPGTSAWNSYWPGALERQGVSGQSLLCPMAAESAPTPANFGFGTAATAWSGKPGASGTVIKIDDNRYREGSYGYNKFLTTLGEFGGVQMSAIRTPSRVPVFLDAAYHETGPLNGTELSPPQMPPDLTGQRITRTSPQHWRFLIARHGRGVNCYFADGSVRWVELDDTYLLQWKKNWLGYRLELPHS